MLSPLRERVSTNQLLKFYNYVVKRPPVPVIMLVICVIGIAADLCMPPSASRRFQVGYRGRLVGVDVSFNMIAISNKSERLAIEMLHMRRGRELGRIYNELTPLEAIAGHGLRMGTLFHDLEMQQYRFKSTENAGARTCANALSFLASPYLAYRYGGANPLPMRKSFGPPPSN